MAKVWKIINGKQVLWDEETKSIVPQTLGWQSAINFIEKTDKVLAKADKAIASQKKEIMDSSLKYAGNQLGNLKSAIGDRLVWGDTPGVNLATQKKLDAQSAKFKEQQDEAQKFFGTGGSPKRQMLNSDLNDVPDESNNTDQRAKPAPSSLNTNSGLSNLSQLTKKTGPSEKKSLVDPETTAKNKWIDATKNSPAAKSEAFTGQERWDLHKKHNNLKWDKKYTGSADAIKNLNKKGSVSDMAEAANKMDWSKIGDFGTNLIANKPLGQMAVSGMKDMFGKASAAKSGFDAAKAFSNWKAGSTALGISNPISLALKIVGKVISSGDTKRVENKRPDKVAWEDPWEIWGGGS